MTDIVTLPESDLNADLWPTITVDHSQKLGHDSIGAYIVVVASFGGVTQKFRIHLEADGDARLIPNPKDPVT